MGRLIEKFDVGIGCDRRSCSAVVPFAPRTLHNTEWWDHVAELERLVAAGWVFGTYARFRAYCPSHHADLEACTCRYSTSTKKPSCVLHNESVRNQTWTKTHLPNQLTALKGINS